MNRQVRRTQSSQAPAMPVSARLKEPGPDASLRDLFAVAEEALEERKRLNEVERACLSRLKEGLEGKGQFVVEGVVWQLRERGGNLYLVRMPTPESVPEL